MHSRLQGSSPLQGIALMIGAMFCFSVMIILIRQVSADVHPMLLVFLRNIASLLILLPWVLYQGTGYLHTRRLNSHIWRAAIGSVSMQLWFYAITLLPLTQAVALSFTTPLFVTVFAIIALKEKAGWRRWSALIIGFIGTLIILRPNMNFLDMGALMVLVSSSLTAGVTIVVKRLTHTEKPTLIVFYMAVFMSLFSFPFALPFLEPLAWVQWLWVLGIAVSSTLAHLLLVHAYLKTEMVVLMPFDFTRLLFTATLAYLAFGEALDGWTCIGAAVIVGSAAYIAHREAKLRKTARFDVEPISG